MRVEITPQAAGRYTRAAPPIRSVYRGGAGFALWEIEAAGWRSYDASPSAADAATGVMRCGLSRPGPYPVAEVRLVPETDAERALLLGCRVYRSWAGRSHLFALVAADPDGEVESAVYEPSDGEGEAT